jgi:protein gp37
MSDQSKIEWTDATWNVVTGCTEVSPGCDRCYAKTFAERWRGVEGHHFENGFDVQLRPERLDLPLRWRKPKRIFVNSMSDLFHPDVSDEYIAKVFAAMATTPRHTYQILTKRHGRMRSLLNDTEWRSAVYLRESVLDLNGPARQIPTWPLPNVPVHDKGGDFCVNACPYRRSLDWVVVGGESGPGARPMHPDWARSLRDQCVSAGVPYLFKQHGAWAPYGDGKPTPAVAHGGQALVSPDGRTHSPRMGVLAPAGSVLMARYGKGRAGRILDGRVWDEFPAPRAAEVAR